MSKAIYRWVERTPNLTPFGEDFDTSAAAISWAEEWKKTSPFLTPEHNAIFLIKIENGVGNIWRMNPGDGPLTLGWL